MSSPREVGVIWDRYEQIRDRLQQAKSSRKDLEATLERDLQDLAKLEIKIRQSKTISDYYQAFAELDKKTLSVESQLSASLSGKVVPKTLRDLYAANAKKVQPALMKKQGHEEHKLKEAGSLLIEADAILKLVKQLEAALKISLWEAHSSEKPFIESFIKQSVAQMKQDATHFLASVEKATTADRLGLTNMKNNMLEDFMKQLNDQNKRLKIAKIKIEVPLTPYLEAFKAISPGGKGYQSPAIENLINLKKRTQHVEPMRMVKTKEDPLSMSVAMKVTNCKKMIENLRQNLNNYLTSPHNTSHKRDNEVKIMLTKLERWNKDVTDIEQQVSNATIADEAGISHITSRFIDGVIDVIKAEKKSLNSIFKGKYSTILDSTLSEANELKNETTQPTPTRRR